MEDVTNKMQLLTVDDKCVYAVIHGCAHTETQRQRGCIKCVRCITHSCGVRTTWTRSEVLVQTEGGQQISRVGVKLGLMLWSGVVEVLLLSLVVVRG